MPIEIRELVIRTTVVPEGRSQPSAPVDLSKAKREIIAACLEALRDQLERQDER